MWPFAFRESVFSQPYRTVCPRRTPVHKRKLENEHHLQKGPLYMNSSETETGWASMWYKSHNTGS